MEIVKSILGYKCPKCRRSKLFKEPFKLSDPLAMHKECSVCHQDFEPEPGFYWGAMFLSYIVSGIMFLIPALILVFGFGWSVNGAMAFVIALAVVTYMKLIRTARSLWIHIVVKFDENYKKVEH